ncbi:MAG: hypothetical protein LiPW41_634 [Parcubacteria group bacterium LiPW_41]|nr:MAG: hypothetical protein LiPW41_634 [Parcubacteria group bacterium LiPW_41]
MLNSKIAKTLLLSIAFVAVALFSTSPVEAMRAESCYTVNTYSIGTCTFRDYVCYVSDSVIWSPSGGSLPAFGIETRAGGWGTNGWGYDFYSGNSWGDQLAGCGLYY